MNLNVASDGAAYLRQIEEWRARRIAALSAEDGWLNLVGRWEITQPITAIGADFSNDIVLPFGPDYVGAIEITGGESALFRPCGSASAMSLTLDKRHPPRFTVDALLLEITTMNGRHALRARDRFSPKRASPPTLEYFPVDPRWRIVARWKSLDEPLAIMVDTMVGVSTEVVVTRAARFTVAEGTFDILATHGSLEFTAVCLPGRDIRVRNLPGFAFPLWRTVRRG